MKNLANKVLGWLNAIPADKYKHCALSAVLAALGIWLPMFFGGGVALSFILSFVIVAGVTVSKEMLLDTEPDPMDAAANFVGAGVVWLTFLISVL